MAFTEESEEEHARLTKYKEEDPIALQDALNTSQAFVQAVRDGDVEELKRVVEDAEEGEILQGFAAQALIIAVKKADLDIVEKLVGWGLPLHYPDMQQAIHLACEITNRENFSKTWRIVKALNEGNESGGIHLDTPRIGDGWTPLCVACADACVPLAFKLLEMKADANVITRRSETPLGLARRKKPEDTEETKEARNILTNMLKDYGAQGTAVGVLNKAHGGHAVSGPPAKAPAPAPAQAESDKGSGKGGYPTATKKKKVVLSMSEVTEVTAGGTESIPEDSMLVLDATNWDEDQDQTREVVIDPTTMVEKPLVPKYIGHDGKPIELDLEDAGPVTQTTVSKTHSRFCG